MRIYSEGEDEYVNACTGPLDPVSCVNGLEGNSILAVEGSSHHGELDIKS